MTSEMVRPTVVSFLATMLRDREKSLPVEELSVPDLFVGKPILAWNLKRYTHALLLAIKTREDWVYDPSENYVIAPESTLVFMTTPERKR